MTTGSENVMERKVLYPGKPFIKAGEEHARAYILQNGHIQSYVMENDKKTIINEYGPGRIICETCLMSDEPLTLFYEATEETTVATLTRSEFQQKIVKLDKTVADIMNHVMNKLNYQYADDIEKARMGTEIDSDALKFMQVLTEGIPEQRKIKYEDAILPHLNKMLKAIKELKEKDKITDAES